MEIINIINPENVLEEEAREYKLRKAARAVVMDDEGRVALLHVSNLGFYKLPGGGIDEGEEIYDALCRECKEEIGCNIEIISELGIVVEYRKPHRLKQVSFCFVAKIEGKKGLSQFTEREEKDGFELVWLPYDDALENLGVKNDQISSGGDYIASRDLFLLRESKKYFNVQE